MKKTPVIILVVLLVAAGCGYSNPLTMTITGDGTCNLVDPDTAIRELDDPVPDP